MAALHAAERITKDGEIKELREYVVLKVWQIKRLENICWKGKTREFIMLSVLRNN